jgi:hypothetical protein
MLGWCADPPHSYPRHSPPLVVHRLPSRRPVRKPSPHTTKAYRQDFEADAILVAGTADASGYLRADEVTIDNFRSAFADVEHPMHLPVHRGAPRRQSDAADRPPENA